MKDPAYKHIIIFIAERNLFLSTEEIILNQVIKTGKSRGVIRLYVGTTLNRLKKRGQIIFIKDTISGKIFWGLNGWTDIKGLPFLTHKPIIPNINSKENLFGSNEPQKKSEV